MRAHTIAVVLAFALLGSACAADQRGKTLVGARYGHGNGYAPARVDKAGATTVGIHNYGGVFSKTIGLMLYSPAGKRTVSEQCHDFATYEYCKTTTVDYAPSQAQLNAYMRGDGGAMLSGDTLVDTHLEITTGDARSGWEARLYKTPSWMRSARFHVSYGYVLGSYDMNNRTYKDLDTDGMTVTREDASGNFNHFILGIPLRFAYYIGESSSLQLVLDNNFYGWFSDGGRSLNHLTYQLWLTQTAYVTAGISSEAFSPENATLTLEVGLAY